MSPAALAQSTKPVQTDRRSTPACRVETLNKGRSTAVEEWLRLFQRSSHARIHHHPDYVATVLPDVDGEAWTLACGDEHDPTTMAVFVPKRIPLGRPLLPGARSALWGVRLAGFGLLGRDDDAAVAPLVEMLADEVMRRAIPVVEFEEIEECSALWQQLQTLRRRGFRFVPLADFDLHHRVRLPSTPEDYWGRFKSKRRYSLRRMRKRLAEYVVERYCSCEQVDSLLEAAHAVSRNTWQTRQFGLRVRASDAERRYLHFLAGHGALRSYVMFRKASPIAFVLSHQWGGTYHYDEVGFDRRLAALSPGNVLLQEIIDDLLTHDRPDVLDFGQGDADYKQLFASEQTRTATIRMLAPGVRGWWQAQSINLYRRLSQSARAAARRFGVAESLRRRLRDRAAAKRS